jgi:catechol 2,3-dioxygenase-like lactoylglutathione lyase family enzyme
MEKCGMQYSHFVEKEMVYLDVERDLTYYVIHDWRYPDTEYVNRLMTHSWGQRVVRFYDPDGNLIEVGTPV